MKNSRCDYENVDSQAAKDMMTLLEETITGPEFIGTTLLGKPDIRFVVKASDNFQYTDPTDGSVTKNQVTLICVIDTN